MRVPFPLPHKEEVQPNSDTDHVCQEMATWQSCVSEWVTEANKVNHRKAYTYITQISINK
jgi:hypothetical protein